MRMNRRGFTLIEVLVVIAIIAVLAALIFPVFSRAKLEGKKTSCLSNLSQIGVATSLYLNDFDGNYPKTKRHTDQPEVDDADGSFDEPFLGSVFVLLYPYAGGGEAANDDVSNRPVFSCPVDADPFGKACTLIAPDAPALTSFVANAYFVFGLTESLLAKPSETILFSERRSSEDATFAPFCDDIYHPWFNVQNPVAPNIDMGESGGAIAVRRHSELSNFAFADGHVKTLPWGKTYAPPSLNLHDLRQN